MRLKRLILSLGGTPTPLCSTVAENRNLSGIDQDGMGKRKGKRIYSKKEDHAPQNRILPGALNRWLLPYDLHAYV